MFSQNGVSDLVDEEPKFAELIVVTEKSNPVLSKKVEELEDRLKELEKKEYELEDLKKVVNELEDLKKVVNELEDLKKVVNELRNSFCE